MKMKSKIFLLGLLGSVFLGIVNAQPPADSVEAVHRRVAAKVERVYEGARKWAESGRDPTVIGKTMEEKVKPLLEAGKFIEADAELGQVLDQLKQDGKGAGSPTAATHATQDISEEVRSKLTHNVGSTFLVFRDKVQGELKVTKEQLDQHKIMENFLN